MTHGCQKKTQERSTAAAAAARSVRPGEYDSSWVSVLHGIGLNAQKHPKTRIVVQDIPPTSEIYFYLIAKRIQEAFFRFEPLQFDHVIYIYYMYLNSYIARISVYIQHIYCLYIYILYKTTRVGKQRRQHLCM